MRCTIKNAGLTKVFDIDGKTVYPSAYMSYAPLQEDFDEMKAHGINVFMFGIYAGDEGINMEVGLRPFCENFFKGYGEYDFTYVDKIMHMLAPTGKEEIYVIPRICIEAPKWWQRLNPEEVGCDYTGQPLRYCFASKKWRRDMMEAIRALIDHFKASIWKDIVIGYHIAAGGTEEWVYQCRYNYSFYDYSECNLQAYRGWLAQKYRDCDTISKKWGMEISNWDQIYFPNPAARSYAQNGFLRDPNREKPVLDYYDFHNQAVADTINYFCREVKEYTDYARIIGVFYGYVAVLAANKKGTHALGSVLNAPYVDFISTPNWFKEEDGAWVMASAVHSTLLHDKMWICEGDLRTSKSTNMSVYLPHAMPDNDNYTKKVWQPLSSMEASESVLSKGLARVLTTPCGIWWFGMFGRWFSDARMMRIIEKTAPCLALQQKDYLKTDVAVIIDESGYKYYGLDDTKLNAVFSRNMDKLSKAGFTFHNYLLSDIVRDDFPADAYKMYIFISCVNPTTQEKEAIAKKLKCDNKTLVWLYASAYYDSALSGFALKEAESDLTESVDFEGQKFCDIGTPGEEGAYSLPTLRFAEGENGYVLARFAQSRMPAALWKNEIGYQSVCILTAAPSSEFYRHIANLAGVHLYNRSGDCVYAGGAFAGLHAMEEGYRRFSLPARGFKATNVVTGEPMKVNDMFVDIYMHQFETVVFYLEKEADAVMEN